jgi:hypothetical protein
MSTATKNGTPPPEATDPQQAEAEYLDAERAALDADQAAADLAERVREGDETVTPAALAEAQQQSAFRRLLAEAAQRKARKAAERAEQDRRQALTKQAVKLLDKQATPAALAEAYETARAAITALIAAVDTHDDTVTEAARLLAEAGAPPISQYERVEHGDGYATQESRPVAASRTAPTANYGPTTAAVAVKTGEARTPVYSGHVLAVLFNDTAEQARMNGTTSLTRDSLSAHAGRHGDQVRRILAADEQDGATA